MKKSADAIAEMICQADKVVVFTGAGISTESGIPDFRSPGGIWSRYNPDDFTYQRFVASEESREKYWEMSTEFYHSMKDVQPNAAHTALAELEKIGKLDHVITQNVDGLHQAAGVSPEKVIELHGTSRTVSCLDCKKQFSRDHVQNMVEEGVKVPRCDACRGIMKPDTISFGQAMPEKETAEAYRLSESCDLLIVIGSSLVVQPAASMPVLAKRKGARLVIVNREPTPYDHMADEIVRDSAGMVMTAVLEKVKEK